MKIDLRHGNCLEVLQTIEDGSVDAIICDLPYGSTKCKWDIIIPFDEMWKEVWRLLKKDGVFITTATQPFAALLITSQLKEFKYEWIWHKSKCGSSFTAKYRPLQKHENVLVFCKAKTTYNPQMTVGKPYYRNRKSRKDGINNHKYGTLSENITDNTGYRHPETVQFFQQKWRRQDQVHPTQKPVELMEYLIKTYTNEGETVLDFVMGSGTTGVAAKNLNRNFIGIEKDDAFFEIAKERLNE